MKFFEPPPNWHIYQLAYPQTSTSPKWHDLKLAYFPKNFLRQKNEKDIFLRLKHLKNIYIPNFFSVSITIPLIFSGIGYHVFIWIWHRNLSKKARTKFDSFSKMNSAHHFTGIALYVFMLYYTCQELSAHKVNFNIQLKMKE